MSLSLPAARRLARRLDARTRSAKLAAMAKLVIPGVFERG